MSPQTAAALADSRNWASVGIIQEIRRSDVVQAIKSAYARECHPHFYLFCPDDLLKLARWDIDEVGSKDLQDRLWAAKDLALEQLETVPGIIMPMPLFGLKFAVLRDLTSSFCVTLKTMPSELL